MINYINYIDYGDPIGNHATDTVVKEWLKPSNAYHVGSVVMEGDPKSPARSLLESTDAANNPLLVAVSPSIIANAIAIGAINLLTNHPLGEYAHDLVISFDDSAITKDPPPIGTATATVSSTTTALPTTTSFISENGSNQIIAAHTSAETLLGSSQYGDTFQGTSANLNGDLIKHFGGNDVIDVTDLNFAHAILLLSYGGMPGTGTLTLSDGFRGTQIALAGNFDKAHFHLANDMHGGTNITYG